MFLDRNVEDVLPLAREWIEIALKAEKLMKFIVLPLAREWIEILLCYA